MTTRSKDKGNPSAPSVNDGFFGNLDVEFLIHELKDPLSVIETAVRMLLEKKDKYGPLTARQAKTLKRALKNAKKARSLIGDLLEVGRSDAGCFRSQRFNALAVVDDVLMQVLEAIDSDLWERLQDASSEADRLAVLSRNGIRLCCPAIVHGFQLCQDETKFRQIVGNLIKNALQHRCRCLDIELDCRDDQLAIEVIDDGPGIDQENRELIFNRYTRLEACATLSRPGHGLGLAGARILARHLGGDITVRNNQGAGAVFCLVLPMTLQE